LGDIGRLGNIDTTFTRNKIKNYLQKGKTRKDIKEKMKKKKSVLGEGGRRVVFKKIQNLI
jgi:hypothetical protein